VVQGIKVLGANVRHREKERAERATLVTQERLVKGKVCSQAPVPMYRPAKDQMMLLPGSVRDFVLCHVR